MCNLLIPFPLLLCLWLVPSYLHEAQNLSCRLKAAEWKRIQKSRRKLAQLAMPLGEQYDGKIDPFLPPIF